MRNIKCFMATILDLPNEFEHVSNQTMSMLVRQMASLVMQAEDMFAELELEVKNVEITSRKIQERVVRLQTTVDNLDCLGEKVGKNRLT